MVQYIFVGEKHGTWECPAAFLDIVKKHKLNKIALELPVAEQQEVDEYLSNKRSLHDLTIFTKNKDERRSRAIKKLLSNAKRMKLKVFFIDPNVLENRDVLMAKNIRDIKGPVAILCGDIHVAKKTLTFPLYMRILGKIAGLVSSKFLVLDTINLKPCASLLPADKTFSYRIIEKSRVTPSSSIIDSPDDAYDKLYTVKKFTPVH